jgi:hypothetical protein
MPRRLGRACELRAGRSPDRFRSLIHVAHFFLETRSSRLECRGQAGMTALKASRQPLRRGCRTRRAGRHLARAARHR